MIVSDVLLVFLWIMTWILLGLVVIVFALVFLVILLSAVPVKYSAKVCRDESTELFVRASWFFRLVRFVYENRGGAERMDFRVLFFKIGVKKKKPSRKVAKAVEKKPQAEKPLERPPPQKKEGFTKRLENARNVLTDLQLKSIIKPVLATMRKIVRRLLPKYIDVSGVVGLPCPFETGLLFGVYETVAGVFRFRDKVRLSGDFDTDVMVLRVNAEVRGRFSALSLALPVIQLILKKPVRTLIWNMLREEKLR